MGEPSLQLGLLVLAVWNRSLARTVVEIWLGGGVSFERDARQVRSSSDLSSQESEFLEAVANLGQPKFDVHFPSNGKDLGREFGR